jgi:hypothetical protein
MIHDHLCDLVVRVPDYRFRGPGHTRPGVYSASDRNEYQKQKNNVSGE